VDIAAITAAVAEILDEDDFSQALTGRKPSPIAKTAIDKYA
jgi:predicted RNA-binding protein associated with RNAse of E/G family